MRAPTPATALRRPSPPITYAKRPRRPGTFRWSSRAVASALETTSSGLPPAPISASFFAYVSCVSAELLVTKHNALPASRSERIDSGAPAIGRSAFHTTPSKSKTKRWNAWARITPCTPFFPAFAPPSYGCYTATVTEIAPFNAIRYDPDAVGDLSKVVAPPYDVISD